MSPANYCAIDFGTSNSAVAIPHGGGMRLIDLEAGYQGMPTAVFYNAEDETRCFGREAIAAYVDGFDGRLMRSIKSILGSDLMDQATEIGHGITIKYIDVVIGYLRHLKSVAEAQHGSPLTRVVIGRPVHFVDHAVARDAKAVASLDTAARAAGFSEVAFQYEPIAAALDYESRIVNEQIVLVADIGGGTSDFSLVRVGPARHGRLARQDDILANHGMHVAGTDFDQSVNLAAIMPQIGYGSLSPQGRRVPGKVYFDLATWHLINTVYAHNRLIELREMISMYGDAVRYRRMMKVVGNRLGHHLAALAEQTKIEVALNGHSLINLNVVEDHLQATFSDTQQAAALEHKVSRIVETAIETVRRANVHADTVRAVYFTGGSPGLHFLTERIAARFPNATHVTGERFSSVANGLGIYAKRKFGDIHAST
ncbi:MAG: Hsp70 family protein [Burkholderiales bacterium]|nr:Hsp70 family protein [Burkholderiales bacterium]